MKKLAIAAILTLIIIESHNFDGHNTLACQMDGNYAVCAIIGADKNGKTGYSMDYPCQQFLVRFKDDTVRCFDSQTFKRVD